MMVSNWHTRLCLGGLRGGATCSISPRRRKRRERAYFWLSHVPYFPWARFYPKQNEHSVHLAPWWSFRKSGVMLHNVVLHSSPKWTDDLAQAGIDQKIRRWSREAEKCTHWCLTAHPSCHSDARTPSNRLEFSLVFWMQYLCRCGP